jgi:hypothetical protein
VVSAVFSPDGHTALTASDDGTARQYVVDMGDLLALAVSRVTRALTPDERATYLGEPLLTPTPGGAPPTPAPHP